MNMFWREIKAYSKFTIIWSCAISAMIIILSLFFPSFYDNAAVVTKVLQSYPESVRNLIGLSPDSLSSFLGFYTFVLNIIVELGVIQAMILGASIIFKEVNEKTADFLFTKPVTRNQIMSSKLCASCVSLVMTTVICFSASSMMASFMSPEAVNMKLLFMLSITLFFVQMIFISIGVLIAVVFPRMKSVTAIAIGTLLLSEIMFSIFKPIVGENAVRYIIPLKYFNSEYITNNASYEATFVILTIILVASCIVASYAIYEKKDVHAA